MALCEKTGTTPEDCENIAKSYKVKRKYQDALSWVEKGLKLEKKGNWGNQSSFGLTGLKQDLLNKLGRREDAFSLAWAEFKKHPSNFSYENLMKFVDKKDVKLWHQKALRKPKMHLCPASSIFVQKPKNGTNSPNIFPLLIPNCLKSSAITPPKKQPKASQKSTDWQRRKFTVPWGCASLKREKAIITDMLWNISSKACKLYEKAGRDQLWIDLVEKVRRDHFRKYSFIALFRGNSGWTSAEKT